MKSVIAKWNGEVIAESNDTIVVEGNHYFPPDSLRAEHLRPSATETHCPWKGTAHYHSVVVGDEVNEDACWFYPEPTREASRLRGYCAFWRGVEVITESDARRRERVAARFAKVLGVEPSDELADRFQALLADMSEDELIFALPPAFIQKQTFFNFHNSTTACFLTDHERRVQTVNPTFEWAFGELGNVIGEPLRELLDAIGVEADVLDACLETLDSHGWVKVPEIRYLRGAEPRCFSLDAVVARHADIDDLSGLQAQLIDITDAVQMRERLEAQTHEFSAANDQLVSLRGNLQRLVVDRTAELDDALGQLSAIIDNIADGLLVVGHDGRVKLTNPALVKMFSLTGALDGHVTDHFSEEVSDLVLSHRGGLEIREVVLPGERVGKAVANSVTSEDGDSLGTVAVVRDVTFEKEVDRMKTDFIANVSHELRTPLTSILGFARIIEKRLGSLLPRLDPDDARVQRHSRQVTDNLSIIVSEGERLTRIINDVLDVAKIEAGKMEWRSEPVPMKELVERSVAATSGLFESGDVELSLEIEGELPTIVGDGERLMQVVVNLISNAAKFTVRGSVRCIAAREAGDVVVSVVDTGPGIPREHQELVFEKFRQVGNTLTDKPFGTGLGLPLCKRVVEHHGGTIGVDSTVGEGSTFSFRLPLVEAETRDERPQLANSLLRRLDEVRAQRDDTQRPDPLPLERTRTVLVVDDDAAIRELIRQELEALGHSVIDAQDGMEAIRSVQASRPDLIVLDVMMPTMNGYEAAAVLKNDPDTNDIPIVIYSVLEDVQRGLQIGVDHYFQKSTQVEELVSSIDDMLQQGRSKKRVLVIDEDESTVHSLSRVLAARGYEVAGVSENGALLERATTFQPDVVVLDALFPDATTVSKALRFQSGLRNVLVLVLGSDGELE